MKEIRDLLEKEKLIIGSNEVIKKLNSNNIQRIFVTVNCPESVKQEINHLAKISSVEVVDIEMRNDELGIYCRKPFNISIVAEIKE